LCGFKACQKAPKNSKEAFEKPTNSCQTVLPKTPARLPKCIPKALKNLPRTLEELSKALKKFP